MPVQTYSTTDCTLEHFRMLTTPEQWRPYHLCQEVPNSHLNAIPSPDKNKVHHHSICSNHQLKHPHTRKSTKIMSVELLLYLMCMILPNLMSCPTHLYLTCDRIDLHKKVNASVNDHRTTIIQDAPKLYTIDLNSAKIQPSFSRL